MLKLWTQSNSSQLQSLVTGVVSPWPVCKLQSLNIICLLIVVIEQCVLMQIVKITNLFLTARNFWKLIPLNKPSPTTTGSSFICCKTRKCAKKWNVFVYRTCVWTCIEIVDVTRVCHGWSWVHYGSFNPHPVEIYVTVDVGTEIVDALGLTKAYCSSQSPKTSIWHCTH